MEPSTISPCVRPKQGECLVDRDPVSLRDHTFGLFDHDPAVESMLQLPLDCLLIVENPILENARGCNVGERARKPHLRFVESAGLLAEDVQCADCARAHLQRHREDRSKSLIDGRLPKCGPVVQSLDVRDRDGLTFYKAGHTGPLGSTELDRFNQGTAFACRSHHLQNIVISGEKNTGIFCLQQNRTGVNGGVEQLIGVFPCRQQPGESSEYTHY